MRLMPDLGHNAFAQIDPDKIAVELSERGMTWADANAAAEALEETKSSVLAHLAVGFLEDFKSAAQADMRAKAAPEYREHIMKMVDARKAATRARVRYDTYKVWIELKRSVVATERAAMVMR